jgi:NADH-quinone oxidoreductase subunit H
MTWKKIKYMLLNLLIHIYYYVWNNIRESLREERWRLRRQGIYYYPDMIYAPEVLYDPKIPGKINIQFIEINWGRVLKWSIIYLIDSIKEYTVWENLILLAIYTSLFMSIYNIFCTIFNFFKAFLLKWQILKAIFGKPKYLDKTFFEENLTYKIYIYNLQEFLIELIWKFLNGLLIVVPILLIIAYSTLLERKILSSIQKWRGPNKVGVKGSVQPLVDGIKLIIKEIIVPVQSENKIFVLASMWSIFCMLLLWFIVPTSDFGGVISLDYELLGIFCISILGSISILLAGWASNSKYSFLGGVWAGAQMISYELVLGLIVLIVMISTTSTQIIDIVDFQWQHGWLFFYLPIETVIFLIIIVAETNRAPFDFAEAESELVSGYNTEYSGLPFAFFFIAEYGNILFMSLLSVLFFFGGWSVPTFLPFESDNFMVGSILLFLKTYFVYFYFLWLRGSLPRYWYDQLMGLCWKSLLPLVLVLLMVWILTFLDLSIFETFFIFKN